jgi:myotubularin-related protein 9
VASKSKSHAPTFTIFLDCVWQIYNQFPCSFEFTERFLVFLADSAYFSNFGTFVCDCDFERALIRMNENTSSLWSYLNRPEILSDYLNCMYEPNRTIIWPSVAPISLVK